MASVSDEVAPSTMLRAMSCRMTLLWSSTLRCCMSYRKRYCWSVSFQTRMMLYSVSPMAVASRSVISWRILPTVSGEMDSLHNLLTYGNAQTSLALHSLNRRFLGLNAECGDQGCELLDVNHNLLRCRLRRKSRATLRAHKRQDFWVKNARKKLLCLLKMCNFASIHCSHCFDSMQ